MYCDTGGVSDARRRAPTRAGVQGIDHVDVLDFAAPDPEAQVETATLARHILLVHTFLPAVALTRRNVRITATQGSAPLGVEWAHAASLLGDPTPADGDQGDPDIDILGDLPLAFRSNPPALTDAERLFLASLPDASRILVVHIAHAIAPAENRAIYTLGLSAPGDGKIDPRLATYEFTLNAEGSVEQDCASVVHQLPARSPSPPLDYLAKDYSSFRQLMLDRMAVVMPEWNSRHLADSGVALVELLAYIGDHLSYYQDAVATEAYLGTARRRVSMRRHARLLDYTLHEGNNARVWVCFEVDPDVGVGDVQSLPAGAQLLTRLDRQSGAVVDGEELGEALLQGAVFFETMFPIELKRLHDRIPFYDWCGGVDCLAEGATEATLDVPYDIESPMSWLAPGDILIFEELDDPASNVQADSAHRHVVCLTEVKQVEDVLDGKILTGITWHEEDALPFALPLRHASGEPAAVAWGNVVLADHGRTVANESLLPDRPPIGERYRPRLPGEGVTHRVPDELTAMRKRSASSQTLQDPRKALPAVTVVEITEGDESRPWYSRRDLLASDPFDRHVTIEIENDGVGSLRFGDGMYGRLPSVRSRWQASYRVGNGSDGNVGADAIAHLMVAADGQGINNPALARVRNPLPAVGGNQAEPDVQARLYAPHAFREGERAVTSDDYATITERHPDVQKAVADIRWTGSWNTVFVTVDRRGGLPLDIVFESELRSFLEPFRMAGQDLEFQPPDFVPLDIAFTVHVAPDHLRSEVLAVLQDTLGSAELTDGTRGFFHPDNFTFGDPVYLSHIVARAMEVPGVMWLDVDDGGGKPNRFQRLGEPSRGEVGAGVIVVGPLQIIRVDNDPVAPHNGRLRLYMEGGL